MSGWACTYLNGDGHCLCEVNERLDRLAEMLAKIEAKLPAPEPRCSCGSTNQVEGGFCWGCRCVGRHTLEAEKP